MLSLLWLILISCGPQGLEGRYGAVPSKLDSHSTQNIRQGNQSELSSYAESLRPSDEAEGSVPGYGYLIDPGLVSMRIDDAGQTAMVLGAATAVSHVSGKVQAQAPLVLWALPQLPKQAQGKAVGHARVQARMIGRFTTETDGSFRISAPTSGDRYLLLTVDDQPESDAVTMQLPTAHGHTELILDLEKKGLMTLERLGDI